MKKINKRKIFKRMLYFLLGLIVILVIATFAILQMDTFGADATGKRLERMKQSKLYKDGQFQNIHHTPAMAEGYSMQKEMISFLFGAKNPKLNPKILFLIFKQISNQSTKPKMCLFGWDIHLIIFNWMVLIS